MRHSAPSAATYTNGPVYTWARTYTWRKPTHRESIYTEGTSYGVDIPVEGTCTWRGRTHGVDTHMEGPYARRTGHAYGGEVRMKSHIPGETYI